MEFFFGKTTNFCFPYHLCFAIKTPMSFHFFGKPVFENHVARCTTRSIFPHPFFARGLAQTPTQQRNKMHHRENCAAQGDSIKVVEEECIARALAHNVSEQAKKLLFLRNSLHLRTVCLSNRHLTLRWWLCGLSPWLGLTGWLLEGSSGRGTLAARSRGRAAGGGTAPDTRRPTEWWQAGPPGDGPPPCPRHAAPTGHAGQGDSVGPPHPHTRAHGTWVVDPNSPPSGRAVGGGTAPDLRRPSQW